MSLRIALTAGFVAGFVTLRRLRLLPPLWLAAMALGAVSAAAAVPAYPPLDRKAAADLEHKLKRIEARAPTLGARDVYGLLLTAVAHDWRPEKWAEIVALGEELHDRDPQSPTYGNYRWYWREPKVNDRNAVEFAMSTAALTWVGYRDRLPADARQALEAALTLGAEGCVRQKVDVSYTNIFLMRLSNCILIGEALNRPELVAKGRAWFDEWFAYTRANGIHEFSSTTYYGTDLDDLGALANFSREPEVRAQAEAALRLIWTDIAANWFGPYEGIAGAHSRDYGFLIGHGYLDQALLRAGWITHAVASESHEAIDDLTFWPPPVELRARFAAPHVVVQRWGAESWERATHYVGRAFTLGTSGAGYGAQDRVFALTLAGGPREPIVSFSLDYRDDPYGQTRMGTADGHEKLTHLLPFVASVQRDSEALLVATYDPAHAKNPAGGKAPIEYKAVDATFVLPTAVQLFDATGRALASAKEVPLSERGLVFLRQGDVATALMFVDATDDRGMAAPVAVVRDGAAVGAQRLTAVLARGTPRRAVSIAIWVRAAEGIGSDAQFAAFRNAFVASAERARVRKGKDYDVMVAGAASPLRIVLQPQHAKRVAVEGADPAADAGILSVNGTDVGGPILAKKR